MARIGKLSIATLAASFVLLSLPALAAGEMPCVRIEASGPGQTVGPNLAPSFPSKAVDDITFTILLQTAYTGDHLLEVEIYTPGGYLYRSIAIPVTDPGRTPAMKEVPGYPRPILAQRPSVTSRPDGTFLQVTTALPVAGTDIVGSALYGRWRVLVRLDGSRGPCGLPLYYYITG